MYTHPRIITLEEHRLPSAPEGWKYSNLVDPDDLTPDKEHYPVLLFGPYTYTGRLTHISESVICLNTAFGI